jgi:hypothetical protein
MTELARIWSNRVSFGNGRVAPLDWGRELWNWDISRYESVDGIREAHARAGLPSDDEFVLFEATRSLVTDVIDAAGGVEQAHARVSHGVGEMQAAHDRLSASLGHPFEEGTGLVDPSIEATWYATEELLVWVRVLDDRLRRPSFDRRRYPIDQGLIPALAAGPRRDAVVAARASLLQAGAREARYLSGLSLHMQSTQAGTKQGKVQSGKVFLRFPDPVIAPIAHRWQLSYREDRDLVSFTDLLMDAVVRFMEEMLDTLEQHVPERFRN